MKTRTGLTGLRLVVLAGLVALICVVVSSGTAVFPAGASAAEVGTVGSGDAEHLPGTLATLSDGSPATQVPPSADEAAEDNAGHALPQTTPPGCVQDLGKLEIELNAELSASGTWSSGCASRSREGSHARFYTFTLDRQAGVLINLWGDEADEYLYLLTGDTNHVLDSNDNITLSGTDSLISITLSGGTYTVEATTRNTGETGDFTLDVLLTSYEVAGLEDTFQEPIQAYRFRSFDRQDVPGGDPVETSFGHYWIFAPKRYTSTQEVAEGINGRQYGGIGNIDTRVDTYRTMLLEFAIQAEKRGDLFVDFEEVRGDIDKYELIYDAYDITVNQGLLNDHLNLIPDEVFTVAAFGTHFFDIWVAAAVNRTIELAEAERKLALLKEAIVDRVPEDEAWSRAFQLAEDDLVAMTSDDAMENWSKAVEQNIDEIAQTVSRLITTKFAAKIAVNVVLKAVAGKFVIATAPISLTVGIVAAVIYHIIDQTDKFWDHITYSAIATQAHIFLSREGITELLDYTKFAFYRHMHEAASVDVLILGIGVNFPKDHRQVIVRKRDQALHNLLGSTSWTPAEDFDSLLEAGNRNPTGIWSDEESMWVLDYSLNEKPRLYRYNLGTKLQEGSIELDLHRDFRHGSFEDIWSDRETVWMSQRGSFRIEAFDLVSGTRNRGKDLAPRNTFGALGDNRGIWSNGATMWVVASAADRIEAYDLTTATNSRDESKDFNALEIAGNNSPRGIWSDGTTMWVVDDDDDRVYAYDMVTYNQEPTRELALFDVPRVLGNTDPVGVWTNETTMWVSDFDDAKIFAYQLPQQPSSIEYPSFQRKTPADFGRLNVNGNEHAEGISADRTTMWVVDHDDDAIYGYDLRTRALARTITALKDAGNGHARGVWSDGTTIWVADHHDDKVYGYNLDDPGDRTLWQSIDLGAAGNRDATGIWSDGTTMWVADDDDDRIYGYDMQAPEDSSLWRSLDIRVRIPTPQGGLIYQNVHARGIWSDGSTMWVADDIVDRIYAFNLSDGSRLSEMEFENLGVSGNGHARGIWSDGNTMWVADHHDDWIYAYQMPPVTPADDGCLQTVSVGQTVSGQWVSTCESEARSGRYTRYYSFTIDQETELTVTLESNDADTYLYLREGNARSGSFLYENDDDGGTTRSTIQATLAAGNYTIEATTYETGNFTLTVSGLGTTTPTPAPDPGTDNCGETLPGDGTLNGTWAAGCDSEVSGRGHARYYSFTLAQESEVAITLESNDADTYLYLRAGEARSGSFLYENDDDGGTTKSTIRETLDAGSYTIEATTYSAGETGGFTLTLSGLGGTTEPPPAGDDCGETLTGDGTVSGIWAAGCDSLVPGRGHARYYIFSLAQQSDVTITLESNDADTYLYLRSGEVRLGDYLYENDDDGGTTRSTIQATLAAGSYTIEATTYGVGETGGFTLAIRGLSGTAPGPGTGESDRDALVALYNATDGPNWANNSGWLSDAPVGQWYGVTTNDRGNVVGVDLPENSLSGTIPGELGSLTSLERLTLGNFDFSCQEIPCRATSPTANRLTGNIPPELGQLSNLGRLHLALNPLTGEIPSELAGLVNLKDLQLWISQLSGNVPSWLGDLDNLQILNLAVNSFSGPIPAELGNLSNLIHLNLSVNQLSGAIPAGLGNLAGLEHLGLNSNQLTGSIPASLGNLSNLKSMYISSNELTGCIPSGLSDVPENDFAGSGLAFCAAAPELGSSASDRAALVAFYNATDGANWANNSGWLSDAPVGRWFGVETDGDGHVTEIVLPDNRLNGALGAELRPLRSLQMLDLGASSYTCVDGSCQPDSTSGNQLTGPIPAEWFSLHSLETLDLAGNPIGGGLPAGLWRGIDRLQQIELSGTRLEGAIPAGIGRLPQLLSLALSDNALTGSIPTNLGNPANLRHLALDNNQLSGSIPGALAGLDHLATLRLAGNQFTGCVSRGLRDIADNDVASLGLEDCAVDNSDPVDRAALVAFYEATGGAHWITSTNWLSAAPIGQWHGVTANAAGRVTELNLGRNNLAGELPPDIGLLDQLNIIDLPGNNLTGELPRTLAHLTELGSLNLQGSRVTGCLPRGIIGRPFFPYCPGRSFGTPPGSAESDRAALVAFYHATNGDNWANNDGWLTDAPISQWFGVNAVGLRVSDLVLENNGLSGSLPTELGDLTALRSLRLGYTGMGIDCRPRSGCISTSPTPNQVAGPIPDSMRNLTRLYWLDLSANPITGEIPPWLGDLRLSSINLTGALFTGSIPDQLGGLDLFSLDLSFNELEGPLPAWLGVMTDLFSLRMGGYSTLSGSLPVSLSRLTALRWMYLGRVGLSGQLPSELGNLTNLRSLYLGSNDFGGSIPSELGSLTNLWYLDLSSNDFSGSLPSELGNLTDLRSLQLAGNNLTGCVPTGLQDVPRNDFDQLGLPFCGL